MAGFISTTNSTTARLIVGLLEARSAQASLVNGGGVTQPSVSDPSPTLNVWQSFSNTAIPIPEGFTNGESILAFREGSAAWKNITLDLTTGYAASVTITAQTTLAQSWRRARIPGTTKPKVVLVLGQSNAVGRDGDATRKSNALAAASITLPLDAPQFIHLDGTQLADQTLDGLNVGPQKAITTNGSYWGPEVGCVDYLMNNDSTADWLCVHCAEGSTNLAVDWDPDSPGTNYGYFETIMGELDSQLGAGNYSIEFVFWVQGESDAGTEAYANAYETNLGNLIDKMASDGYTSTATPWIISPLNPEWSGIRTYHSTVLAAQQAVAAARSNVHLISVTDLTEAGGYLITGDTIHYTASGSIAIGQRAAAAFLAL